MIYAAVLATVAGVAFVTWAAIHVTSDIDGWADGINADSARAAGEQVRGETIHSTDLA
jgi:hypothetical protein